MCCGVACLACGCAASGVSSMTKPRSPASRLPYLLLVALTLIFAFVVNLFADEKIDFFLGEKTLCEMATGTSDKCVGNQIVFRASFVLFIFFLVHVVAMLTSCGNAFHVSMWGLKLLLWLGGLIAVFFIRDEVFNVYADIARVVSVLFIVLQMLIFVDVAYRWNDVVVNKAQEGGLKYLLIGCILLYAGVYTALGFFYGLFTGNDATEESCRTQSAAITATYVITGLLTVVSMSGVAEHGSLLVSSIVTAYSTWQVYTALNSDPSTCNTVSSGNKDVSSPEMWMSLVFALASLVWIGFSASRNVERVVTEGATKGRTDPETDEVDEEGDPQTEQLNVDVDEEGRPVAAPADEEQEKATRRTNLFFHVVMTLIAMYSAMLFTNWGDPSSSDDSSSVDRGDLSMWLKLAAQWLVWALYLWTLVAPKLFPDRDFGHNNEF